MDDADLLAKLIGQYDSREEAEHIVDCEWCGDGWDGYERCPDNPVEVARRKLEDERQAGRFWAWMAAGCPLPTEDERLMIDCSRLLRKSLLAQIEHSNRIMESWLFSVPHDPDEQGDRGEHQDHDQQQVHGVA